MTAGRKLQIVQSLGCAISAILAGHYGSALEGTEFSGGSLTGPLLRMNDAGVVVFAAATLLSFLLPRIAAAAAIMASLLSFPLYAYFVAPGFFRALFKAQDSVPTNAPFLWDSSAIIALLVLAFAVFFGLRILCRRPFD